MSPFSLEILRIFLSFSVISSPLFSSFENFCHSSFGPSGLVLRFFLPVIFQLPVLLFRKSLRLYLLNLLLSFSFVFWMFLSWRHGRVCVKHIYVHIYNWFLSWLKYAVFPLRMSRIILKVLSAWYLSPPLWFASSALPSHFILETQFLLFWSDLRMEASKMVGISEVVGRVITVSCSVWQSSSGAMDQYLLSDHQQH